MGDATNYPRRPRFFANHFVRVLAKACVANDLGPEACWLLTVVVLTEDAKGYRAPVTFFNGQLAPLVGCQSVKALDRVRAKAVAAGWLAYHPGGKGKAGQYWVEIPAAHRGWDDAPTDEPAACDPAGGADYSWPKSTREPPENRHTTATQVGREPPENRHTSGQHSSLYLPQDNPSLPQDPLPPAGVGPSPEEVVAEWNRHPGLVAVAGSDPNRSRDIRARAFDPLWVEHWRAAIAHAAAMADGPNGWRPDLTWFLRPGKFVQTVEKMLAAARSPPPAAPRSRREADIDAAFREAEARRRAG